MMEDADGMLQQRAQLETKQRVLDAFKSHFTVDERELVVLTSTAEPVDDQFFRVLAKVRRVHRDCQVLLGTENQTLGLEILEQSSKQLNAAFQKLFRWTQREFKSLDLQNPQISATIRRALRVLAERPTLFHSCLDSFAEAREHILTDAFYVALSGSNHDYDSTTNPIDFNAHDPLRYAGDMLAWTHSTTVSEREALETLFISEGDEIAKEIQAGLEGDPWSRAKEGEQVFDGRKALDELVDRDLAGVARLLRQRMEQAIHSQDDPVLAYKISNLVSFYRSTLAKLVGDQSGLSDTLASLQESALRQLRNTMRDRVASVQQTELTVAPDDLKAPDFLVEALDDLYALMKSYDSALTTAGTDDTGFEPILEEALDPFLKASLNMERALQEPDSDIFAINCFLTVKANLTSFKFTRRKIEELNDSIAQHVPKLVEYQHRYFLHNSGLHQLIVALAPLLDSQKDVALIRALSVFKPDALEVVSQTLDDFLPSAMTDALHNIRDLQSPGMAHKITEEAAARFCEDFEFIEAKIEAADALLDDSEGTDEGQVAPRLRDLFPRTSAEIRVLLS